MTPISPAPTNSQRHVYEVTELNQKIKKLLEGSFPFIWITGEISNFRTPSSGHCYFTLKDARSQIGAVMFRTQARALKFKPEDGLSVIGLGRISVYEPRGAYQVILEYLEPKGIGGLQIAFEKLKQQLSDEGLFDEGHKQALPLVPKKISIVTSPTGAAVRDFINVAQRRFPNMALEVVPASVQGERSPEEIVRALDLVNTIGKTDVIVLARGGGSIEDLCAFNDERVARAIFSSRIPVVSAVGHETDFTIADFVADLRAPTPSAAAEIIVPSKEKLKKGLDEINQKLYKTISFKLELLEKLVLEFTNRIVHPQRRLQDMRLRLDDYSMRLVATVTDILARKRDHAAFGHHMLINLSPGKTAATMKDRVRQCRVSMCARMIQIIRDGRAATEGNAAMLEALNPMAILQRGYSITRTLPGQSIVRSARQVKMDQRLEIMLGQGRLTVDVKGRAADGH
ncbi:exodeoxyribonuclease 7 large subunit [Desulfosarcina alkanivorans]|jgi:exodeoxyribonuclease VII large subunit|uniref:Exodeoxyribonuclease 7 large subunit n=1 Tax=Desulfosarcina alkanivorans TaxID=571177 RepID=A0A5K7YEE1_9BACT|nr:exodeoxyribonuclease VII large subunit [Desulfosarcina alkanivorans]BBO67023.1 exodeoxyribonuclease 7 large subunit [Desulfosarcina alkanivorans]